MAFSGSVVYTPCTLELLQVTKKVKYWTYYQAGENSIYMVFLSFMQRYLSFECVGASVFIEMCRSHSSWLPSSIFLLVFLHMTDFWACWDMTEKRPCVAVYCLCVVKLCFSVVPVCILLSLHQFCEGGDILLLSS